MVTAAREHRAAAARLHPAAMGRTFTLRDLADLLSGVTAAELDAAAGGAPWVRQVADAASRRRGWCLRDRTGSTSPTRSGGRRAVFARMAAEVDDALVPVVRALRRAADACTG